MSALTLVPVVLSGGSGTRLWPLSRRLHPKQLLPLVGERTMLQQTVARVDGLAEAATIVVCNREHGELVRGQLETIDRPAQAIVLEPVGRNTAPALALAALLAQTRAKQGDPLLLCLPADHVVLDRVAFRAAVQQGRALACAGQLVTFGIVPDHPHTGYGYIRAAVESGPCAVRAFVEKPDRATAEGYLQEGGYYWNSGMFLLRAGAYLDELRVHAPEIVDACEQALARGHEEGSLVHVHAETFAACPADSIDYAVMEKTSKAAVVPLAAGWSDVGSWAALHEVGGGDEAGNDIAGDVLAIDCEGSLLRSHHRLVAAIGLRDMVVVETADAILVAPRERSEEVKRIVTELERNDRIEVRERSDHVHPWGEERRIQAQSPAALISLRLHPGKQTPPCSHRSFDRRLVVTAGKGSVIVDGDDLPQTITAGQSVVIPADTTYTLVAAMHGLQVLAIDLPTVDATQKGS